MEQRLARVACPVRGQRSQDGRDGQSHEHLHPSPFSRWIGRRLGDLWIRRARIAGSGDLAGREVQRTADEPFTESTGASSRWRGTYAVSSSAWLRAIRLSTWKPMPRGCTAVTTPWCLSTAFCSVTTVLKSLNCELITNPPDRSRPPPQSRAGNTVSRESTDVRTPARDFACDDAGRRRSPRPMSGPNQLAIEAWMPRSVGTSRR